MLPKRISFCIIPIICFVLGNVLLLYLFKQKLKVMKVYQLNETPDFKEVKAFLDAGEYTAEEVNDLEYLDYVLSNMGEYYDFKAKKQWRKEMALQYQEYYFKAK